MAEKPHLNLVTMGHVDHGKSTLMGRILYDTGNFPEKELRKLKEIAKEKGKETFEFAYFLDHLKEERERGLTIDIRHKRFDTDKYYFTIIDAPGHSDFVKNMITGASQADAALMVVSAKEGVQAQTNEHGFLAKILGIKQLIVAISKMDLVNYSEDRFKEVKEDLSKVLKSIGFEPEKIQFVPTSAYLGDNAANPSEKLKWFDGPTVLEALDTLEVPKKPIDKPLRVPVQEVYSISGVGTVPVGRVETGVLKKGDEIKFLPADVSGTVKSVEMHHEEIPKAEPGDNIGFNVRGVGKDEIKRGDVAVHPDKPVKPVKSFKAQIVVLEHPSAISPGYTPVFHCHTAQVACAITEIERKIDPKTSETIEEKPDFIKAGDSAIVEIEPTQPLIIESQKEMPELSRFAVRDMGKTVAAGMCIETAPAE